MGSKLVWLVLFVGALLVWGNIHGNMWQSLQAYASGGQTETIKRVGATTGSSGSGSGGSSGSGTITAAPTTPPGGVAE